MRISLNQKPNSSKDFGFQAAWDSTGARITSVQPGNNSEIQTKGFECTVSGELLSPLIVVFAQIQCSVTTAVCYILHTGTAS